jgi:hypothetical protein
MIGYKLKQVPQNSVKMKCINKQGFKKGGESGLATERFKFSFMFASTGGFSFFPGEKKNLFRLIGQQRQINGE